jgi:hypothetical protein
MFSEDREAHGSTIVNHNPGDTPKCTTDERAPGLPPTASFGSRPVHCYQEERVDVRQADFGTSTNEVRCAPGAAPGWC